MTPRHSRISRVPAFNEIAGGLCALRASDSTLTPSSLRRIDLERPPSSLSWSLEVMPRSKRSRESRIGGGARCSRRHSPRNSKIVAAQSRASSFARLIDVFSMSAAAPRLDAVAADPVAGLERCERKPELPFHRARQKPAHAMMLPAGCLHHFLDARSRGLAEEREHALLLGDPLAPWVFSLNRRFGSADSPSMQRAAVELSLD